MKENSVRPVGVEELDPPSSLLILDYEQSFVRPVGVARTSQSLPAPSGWAPPRHLACWLGMAPAFDSNPRVPQGTRLVSQKFALLIFVRPVGVEPTTHSLKGSCSTS